MASSSVQPLVLDIGGSTQGEKCADSDEPEQCLLCQERFNLSDISEFLKHILELHQLVIGDVDNVSNLKSYVQYWRPRLSEAPLRQYCVKMKDTDENSGDEKFYYMLCPVLPEDKQLRSKLKRKTLQQILKIQQREREDNSKTWQCLFCGESFNGNRSLVLNHMNEKHGFNIGHPDNLVNVENFLSKLHQNLDSLLCLYCEKTFKDRFTLKEHMRKKLHKKLNPHNKLYDQYYLVNYLELGKDKETVHKKTYTRRGKGGVVAFISAPDSDVEEDWHDCDEISEESLSVCLFCKHTESDHQLIFSHMCETHQFDMEELTNLHSLSFYQQVKVINYIRRQVHELQCLKCQEKYETLELLLGHMTTTTDHITIFIDDKSTWDQPEYYFPTFENDNLLSGLHCDDNSPPADDWVIPEDSPNLSTLTDGLVSPIVEDTRIGD